MIDTMLIKAISEQYAQSLTGRHGLSHWARVLENGRKLAALTGAKPAVVELFAVFHDAKRVTESIDADHGRRGAEYAATIRGRLFDLSDEDFDLLQAACVYHTSGTTDGDITVQTCWDSDRLDLNRIGISPDPKYLCTDAAKAPEMIDWANKRSKVLYVSSLIFDEWGFDNTLFS